MVHYNDLLDDLDGEMRRVAKFLDIPINQAVWPSLVQAARFSDMQAAADSLMPHLRLTRTDGPRSFFHKGAIGRWRDILTPDDLALYKIKFGRNLPPPWLRGSREEGKQRAIHARGPTDLTDQTSGPFGTEQKNGS